MFEGIETAARRSCDVTKVPPTTLQLDLLNERHRLLPNLEIAKRACHFHEACYRTSRTARISGGLAENDAISTQILRTGAYQYEKYFHQRHGYHQPPSCHVSSIISAHQINRRFCNDLQRPLGRRTRPDHVCGSDFWRASASSQRLARLADRYLSGRGRLRRCRCGGDGSAGQFRSRFGSRRLRAARGWQAREGRHVFRCRDSGRAPGPVRVRRKVGRRGRSIEPFDACRPLLRDRAR